MKLIQVYIGVFPLPGRFRIVAGWILFCNFGFRHEADEICDLTILYLTVCFLSADFQ